MRRQRTLDRGIPAMPFLTWYGKRRVWLTVETLWTKLSGASGMGLLTDDLRLSS